MATRKTERQRPSDFEPSLHEQAERLQASLGESAQQIWLAGLGAFSRAQAEGSKLFDTLVREGSKVEARTRDARAGLADGVEEVRSRAGETLGRVDQVFRARVGEALKALEVPTRRELGALADRIDALNQKLRAHNERPTAGARARRAAARSTPPGPAPVPPQATEDRPVRKPRAAPRAAPADPAAPGDVTD
ncbi:phasin family protein [Pseudoxanthomonas sp. UC19_8]|uniref:phasin family protein n=1 Tax=Pseudoxanthomonas sp. UC19_8 TaxID=3350175 RepID=UPI0036D3117A